MNLSFCLRCETLCSMLKNKCNIHEKIFNQETSSEMFHAEVIH